MYVSNVIFCENVAHESLLDGTAKTNALGLLSRGEVLSVPSFYSMCMMVLINAESLDSKSRIKISVKNPKEDMIFDQEVDLSAFPRPLPPAEVKDLHMSINFQNLVIDELGYYTFEILINSLKDYECKFLVSQKVIRK